MDKLVGTFKIVDDKLNFRESIELTSKILETCEKGESVEVYETIKDDDMVRARTNKGWTTLYHNKNGFFLAKVEETIRENVLNSDLTKQLTEQFNNKLNVIEETINNEVKKHTKLLKDPKKVMMRCNDVKEFLKSKYPNGFNISSLPDATTCCMRYVAHIRNINGSEKKKLVMDSISLLLDETDSGSFEFLDPIIKEMLPNIIDTIVNVERKKIKINKSLNKGCCGCTRYV